ncbi:MAG: alpha-ribazole phosphatase [Tepidiforma sp.]|nr:MAG: alpha-ribazole phosphatase [Tepidiforma sp.]
MSLLYLVRHGQTNHNAEERGLGRADVPLSPLGRRQAEALARRFERVPLDAVLSSPLQRAADVARAIAAPHRLPVELLDALTELDVGDTEHLTYPEIRERFPDFYAAWTSDDPVNAAMPGGESIADLARRLAPLASDLLAGPDEVLVIVSHNFTLRVLVCLLLGAPLASFRNFRLDLASVTTISIQHRRAAIQALNDTSHLDKALNLAAPARSVSP